MNTGCVFKFDVDGNVLDCLWDLQGTNHPMITSMREDHGFLYIGGILQQPHRQMAHSRRRCELGRRRILLGSEAVTSVVRRAWDRLRGGGDHSVTVPPMDGALNPNNRLDEAAILAEADTPDNLCLMGGRILFSSGASVLEVGAAGGGSPATAFASFDSAVTSLAALGEALAVGLAGGQATIRGGPHDGWALSSVAGRPLRCVTALAFADPHTLLLCQGSALHAANDWKRDLMELGSSGSVWRDRPVGRQRKSASPIGWPFRSGCMAGRSGDDPRRRKLAPPRAQLCVPPMPSPEIVLPDLPAYPARISPAADGRGAWLCLFAPRRQLTEFVLREQRFRERMMAEVAPDHWVAPDARADEEFP